MILAAAVGLGYLATPDAESRWVVMNLGSYRGLYNSAYIGMASALAGALWITLGGFYVVRNAITRDERSGVGELSRRRRCAPPPTSPASSSATSSSSPRCSACSR